MRKGPNRPIIRKDGWFSAMMCSPKKRNISIVHYLIVIKIDGDDDGVAAEARIIYIPLYTYI